MTAQAAPLAQASPATGTSAAIIAAFARAHTRAAAATWTDANGAQHTGLVAYRTAAYDVFEVPSTSEPGTLHRVMVHGRRWTDLSCDCRAGAHIACIHRAVVVHGRRHHVWAKRPERAATPADVALSAAIEAEIYAEMPATAPVAPSFVQRLRATPPLAVSQAEHAARCATEAAARQDARDAGLVASAERGRMLAAGGNDPLSDLFD